LGGEIFHLPTPTVLSRDQLGIVNLADRSTEKYFMKSSPSEIVINPSRARIFLVFLIAITLTAFCVFVIAGPFVFGPKTTFITWFLSPVWFGMDLVITLCLISGKPSLKINHNGITIYQIFSNFFIPWHDVLNLSIFTYDKQEFLDIDVRKSKKYWEKMNWLKRISKKPDSSCEFRIPLIFFSITAKDLAEKMNYYSQAQAKY
jgi:hypothetical protein